MPHKKSLIERQEIQKTIDAYEFLTQKGILTNLGKLNLES